MGYELWTSPVTGYRRKGTRLTELRELFDDGITSRAILEPLQSCPADAPSSEMIQILRERDFDVAGIKESKDGPFIGFVQRESLQDGTVRQHLETLTAEHLISESTPLASLLSIFKTRKWTFVLVGAEVKGIITRADLNKPAMRVYLFSLTSLLEMHMTFWVRHEYPDEGWKERITSERLQMAQDLLVKRRVRKEQVGLLECLQYCDKRDLVVANDKIRNELGIGSRNKSESRLRGLESLRDRLAHSQLDLAEGSSWEKVIELAEWAEAVINTSDTRIEEKAGQSALAGQSTLWGAV